MVDLASTIFRDFETDGVPGSGTHKPRKSKIREWGAYLEGFITAFTSNGGLIFDTRASLFISLAYPPNSQAWVISDPTIGYNGIYRKIGASGSGSWTRVADLPYSFIRLIDAGAGTANAIVATSSIPLPGAASAALLVMNASKANTGPVTVAVNGAAAKPLKTSSGNDLASGYLAAGMLVAMLDSGASFRLLSDVASASIVAAAEAAAADAIAAAALAEAAIVDGYMSKAGDYTMLAGDIRKMVEFTAPATAALTAAAALGAGWACWIQASGGPVVIDPNGAETIDGKTTLTINAGQVARVFCTGAAFESFVTTDARIFTAADTSPTLVAGTQQLNYTSISANRAPIMPLASTQGQTPIVIRDVSGSASATKTIVPVATSPDVFKGDYTIDRPYGVIVGQPVVGGYVWSNAISRRVLTAATIIYVATTGNDSNDGLTVGAPLLTLQAAWNLAASWDTNGFDVTILCGAGTVGGSAGMIASRPLFGGGRLIVSGASAATTTLQANANNLFLIYGGAEVILTKVKLQVIGASGYALFVKDFGRVSIVADVQFGSVAGVSGSHMWIESYSKVTVGAPYTISGGAFAHVQTSKLGIYSNFGNTVTLTGTPAFSGAFFGANTLGMIEAKNGGGTSVFSGAATGVRWSATQNGGIDTGTATPNTAIPGNANGAASGGGFAV